MQREGLSPEDIAFVRQVEMRYVGQSYELTVALPEGAGEHGESTLSAPEMLRALEAFHIQHDRTYGYSAPDEPVELVNLRLTAIGQISKPRLRELEGGDRNAARAQKATRPVYFAEKNCYVDCPIYNRYRLGARCILTGPAIVEEVDSTSVIHPGYQAVVDRFGNLILTKL